MSRIDFLVLCYTFSVDLCEITLYVSSALFTGIAAIIWYDCPSAYELTMNDMDKTGSMLTTTKRKQCAFWNALYVPEERDHLAAKNIVYWNQFW